jgi:hypothetical protein
MLLDALTTKYGPPHPLTLYSAAERDGDQWDPSKLVAPESATVGPRIEASNAAKAAWPGGKFPATASTQHVIAGISQNLITTENKRKERKKKLLYGKNCWFGVCVSD